MKIDINVLKELYSTYGVTPIEMIKGAKQVIASGKSSKAESSYEPILTGNDYIWSENDSAYHKNNQTIYCFPKGIFIWTLEGVIGRTIQGLETLQKWIQGDEKYPEGKVNNFIELYNQKTGQKTSKTIDRMAISGEEPSEEPMSGPVPDRSSVGAPPNEVDRIINQAKKKAGYSMRLSSDDIIDLYNKTKSMSPENREKLMTFIKTLKPLQENYIKKSSLQKIIQEIVKNIVKEISKKKEVDEETGTSAVAPVTGPNAFKKKVDEMTTTSGGGGSSAGTPGYNIPGAFSNKMNNKKHIEVLGYKMTPAGEKEFNRPGDKKI